MNIVYLLENKTRTEGRRFYIGSKQECTLEIIDGVPRIISLKNGRPYYGSATCPTMKEDMAAGHTFSASILEEVPNKKFLLEAENKWIMYYNAVDSSDYYNRGYARLGGAVDVDQTCAYNTYGETIVEYGKHTSAMNKKQGTALKYGFKNVGEFSVWIASQFALGYSSTQISVRLGWERHAPQVYISKYNMEKCILEYSPFDTEKQKQVRDLFAKNASIKKIADMLSIEIPTVCLYIGDYNKATTKSFSVAQRRGYSKEELEVEVTSRILRGEGFLQVSRELTIDETSCKRYFMRCVIRHLKPEDLKKG